MISVVIPAFNREKTIERAINSILRQCIEDLEIIVVDDGSSDKTAEIVKGLNIPQLRYIYQENGGVSKARNTGILAAKGEYIAFLDSDDFLKNWSLLFRKDFLDSNPQYDGIAGSIDQVRENLEIVMAKTISDYNNIQIAKLRVKLNNSNSQQESFECFVEYNRLSGGGIPFTCSSLMIRKSTIDKVGLYNENLRTSEDLEFFYRLVKNSFIKYDYLRVFAYIQYQDEGLSRKLKRGEITNDHQKALDIIKEADGIELR